MNGVTERYEIKLKQTSKGIWYCDGLTLSHEQARSLIAEADGVMEMIEGVLKDHNQAEDEPEKEAK